MSKPVKTLELKNALEKLPQVKSVGKIEIEDSIIKHIAIESKSAGRVAVHQLDASDSPALFDFYFKGLSEKSRRNFTPYPLFNTPPSSAGELSKRIADWRKENDWSAIMLVKGKQVIGVGLLKRFRTEQVTYGQAIRDKFQGRGLGQLLQAIIIGQACLVNVRKFHVKVVSDNIASVRMCEKGGFKKTGIVPWDGFEDLLTFLNESDEKNGVEVAERHIIEMVIEFNHEGN